MDEINAMAKAWSVCCEEIPPLLILQGASYKEGKSGNVFFWSVAPAFPPCFPRAARTAAEFSPVTNEIIYDYEEIREHG
jgi:hypothetical protein